MTVPTNGTDPAHWHFSSFNSFKMLVFLGWSSIFPQRHNQWCSLVPFDRRDARLQLHLARLHGGHSGAFMLQIPACNGIVPILGWQQKRLIAIPWRGSSWSQGICQGRKCETHWGSFHEGNLNWTINNYLFLAPKVYYKWLKKGFVQHYVWLQSCQSGLFSSKKAEIWLFLWRVGHFY